MNTLLKNTIFILLFLNSSISFSQDLFIYKDGEELEVKVLRINKEDISYKKFSNINGPEYIEDKVNLFMIKYENGSKDIFQDNIEKKKNIKTESTKQKTKKQDDNCKHSSDSIIFMNNKYMVVCKDCNKKVRYATSEEVKLNRTKSKRTNTNNSNEPPPCGEKPKKPINTFNKYQFKLSKEYKLYERKLSEWKDCVGE
jgi:hypothetical protein